jgi:hypothetical protein
MGLVELWFDPVEPLYPGGWRSTYGSLDDALGEAVHLIQQGRSPAPNRIVDQETGNILADKQIIAKAVPKE